MDAMVKNYLDTLYYHLNPLPEAERIAAVREIEQRIAEGERSGQPAPEILAALGEPTGLAQGFLANRQAQPGQWSPQPQPSYAASAGASGLATTFFFIAAIFASLFVVPTLGGLALGFGVAAIAVPAAGIFGASVVPDLVVVHGMFGATTAPALVIPITLVLGAIFGLITWGSVMGLVGYFRLLGRTYRRMLPGHAA